MQYPQGPNDGAKKMKLFAPGVVPGDGFAESLDPTVFNVNDDSHIPGMMAEESTEMFDANITLSIAAVNTELPDSNNNVDKLPWGAMIFMRATKDRTDMEKVCVDSTQNVIDFKKLCNACTPEEMNYQMHLFTQDNTTERGPVQLSLEDMFRIWKPLGVCQTKAVDTPDYPTTSNDKLVVEARMLKVVKQGRVQLQNHVGDNVAPHINQNLFWVWVEQDIGLETTYILGDKPSISIAHTLSNGYKDPAKVEEWVRERYEETMTDPDEARRWGYTLDRALNEFKQIGYVPKIVCKYSSENKLPDSELMYWVTEANGKKVEKRGFAFKSGTVTQNESYKQETMSLSSIKRVEQVRDMTRVGAMKPLQVYCRIQDRLYF